MQSEANISFSDSISAQEAFFQICQNSFSSVLIDVRSEGEFLRGSFPGAINIPILNNENRHLVGLCYKQKGQVAAIDLGEQLVRPLRSQIVKKWQNAARRRADSVEENFSSPPFVFCWRGGLRSKISCQWMKEIGLSVVRIEEGFKGLRREALRQFAHFPPCVVVGGKTGAGKTQLLENFSLMINLEELAHHRGSAFGGFFKEQQPTQLDFEHSLAVQMAKKRGPREILIEDESRLIGRLVLPKGLYHWLAQSPFIYLESSVSERVENIYRNYVEELTLIAEREKQTEAQDVQWVSQYFLTCVQRIRKKLGGVLTDNIQRTMQEAFKKNSKELHWHWIEQLLTHYYDPFYQYAFSRKCVQPIFIGNWHECLNYLKERQQHD